MQLAPSKSFLACWTASGRRSTTFAAISGSWETLASDAGCNSITCPSLWRWRTGSSVDWEVTVRVGLISLIAILGCVAAVGAAPRSADDRVPPSTDSQKALKETPITRPIVSLDQLIDQIPDGGIVIELYKGVRSVQDVEAANEYVKAQVIKAQSIAADVARLHAATFKSCDSSEALQIETIANKARGLSTTLARVDAEPTKPLIATRQSAKMGRSGSTTATEAVNRLFVRHAG